MARHGIVIGVFGAIALLVAACSDDHWVSYGGGRSRAASADECAEQTSCGTCTPVLGCGWCAFPDGTGACVTGPGQCRNAQVFSWTWEPTGCRVTADASAIGIDSSAPPPPEEDASTEEDASVEDAGTDADAN